MLDINQLVRIASKKTDHALLRVHGDAIAIRVLLGGRNDRSHRDIFDFSYSLKNIAHLSPLNCKLMFVVDVLISASAAMAKVRALRLDPIRRRLSNIDKFGLGELFFLPHDLRRHKFTLDRIRNKNSLPTFPPDAHSAESDVFDF